MKLNAFTPPFRHVVRCVAYLVLLVATTGALVLAAIHVPGMSHVFNPHSTLGGTMLIGVFLLALLDFVALMYVVPRAAVELYRQPLARTAPHWVALVAGVIALVLVGIWLNWIWHR
jgi:hypothetical protein